jgi:galactosylceramidase
VAIIGSHYPVNGAGGKATPASCQLLNTEYGKPLWTSEGWNLGQVNDWKGAMNLAQTINQNYVTEEQTAMIVWNLIYSWYSIFPFAHPDGQTVGGMGHGLMSATEPWSGHYRIMPTLYAVAHTTQFTTPGKCRYVQ